MKVNTDGCLLGGWATGTSPQNILDIGTGSGVIALMLAQKYPEAQVEAVEIDEPCASQCAYNFEHSPFVNRLFCHTVAIQDFNPKKHFDLIVSNPPYFQNDTPAHENRRLQARHQTRLTLADLFTCVANLLSKHGNFCVILPIHLADKSIAIGESKKLILKKRVIVHPLPGKPAHRVLLSFAHSTDTTHYEDVNIETKRGEYSQTVTKWLKPYYLHL